MTFRELIPSYLHSNDIGSLRFELCDIVYDDYKGATFFLNQQLEQKKKVLAKVNDFLKKHPEISEHKEDSKYWYPYPNVDGSKNLSLYTEYYPNTDDEITYFCREDQNSLDYHDYLYDPVKLHFNLMCLDIRKMDCDSPTAKEIIKINNELFNILYNAVGDTLDYNGKNTLEHIQNYIQESLKGEQEVKSNPDYTDEFKDYLLRDYRRFTDNMDLINPAIIVCNADNLGKELPNESSKIGQKKKI